METAAAKEAALEKMRNGDFSGALELAVEARNLSPGVAGFDQMITVCNVHCAAAADGKDWYKILDVAAEADEAAVKRQIVRMSVALHPDKNGLPGATEAFQLIVEAKAVLGDIEKRRVYDSTRRADAMEGQWGFGFSRFRDSVDSNGFGIFRGETNEPSAVKLDRGSRVLDDGEVEILDYGFSRFLNDQKIDLSSNGVIDSGGFNWDNAAKMLQNDRRGRGRGRGSKLNEPNNIKGKATIGRGRGSKLNESNNIKEKATIKRPRGRPRGIGSKLNEPNTDKLAPSEIGSSNLGISRFHHDEKFQMDNSGGPNCENGFSTSQSEMLNEPSSVKQSIDKPKRPRGRPPGRGRGRGRGPGRNVETSSRDEGEIAKTPKATAPGREACKRARVIRPDSAILEYTVAEFNDFERERSKECFKTGQIWAVYDTLDAMPRFYAMIDGVLDDGKLQITWLEPLPEDEGEMKWLYRGLPAACGRFKMGYSEVIQDYAVFSHRAEWKRDAVLRKVYAIRPRKGETWAVFKNWETVRSQCLDTFEYEVVEIVSDYYGEFGVSVAVLVRVEGFGCVFERKEGSCWEVIGVKDRLRFSHRVPSFPVSVGGVGSFFELDPASFELDPASSAS